MGIADSKYIDLASGLPRLGNNEGLYQKLLVKFEGSVDIGALEAALAAQDYKAAGEIVHAAKGVAGNLSLAAFFDCSSELMEQLRSCEAPEPEKVEEFKRLYGETVKAINDYLQ